MLDMAHRDMIREADGEALMSMWRINMLQFWRKKHNKYMIFAHRLLAGIVFQSVYFVFYIDVSLFLQNRMHSHKPCHPPETFLSSYKNIS